MARTAPSQSACWYERGTQEPGMASSEERGGVGVGGLTSEQVLTHWAGRSGPWPGAAAKPAWTLAVAVAR